MEEKRTYERPEMEIIEMADNDIVTGSGDGLDDEGGGSTSSITTSGAPTQYL